MGWAAWYLAACARPAPAVAERPAVCGDCHPDVLRTWSDGIHAQGRQDPLFAASFARAADPWCLGCHEPDGDHIGCGTCHERQQTCASCHGFDLPASLGPDGPGPPSGVRGQDTDGEHARSDRAAEPCTACHDPHGADGAHDVDRVRRTVRVTATRAGDGVDVRFVAQGAGHAVPTGDPFRRLRFEVCADLGCRRISAWLDLERRLAPDPVSGWRVAEDTRIPPSSGGRPGEVRRHLAADPAVAWQLVYHLADPRDEAVPGSSYLVANGVLP